jgi:hypothetical protein
MGSHFSFTIVIFALNCPLAFTSSGADEPKFEVVTQRTHDKVEIIADKGRATISVRSPSGIGNAVIKRTENNWPEGMFLRLHLKGLEELRLCNGEIDLEAAVSSHDKQHRVCLAKGKEKVETLDPKSLYWMKIRIIGADGMPSSTIPLEQGYFEMQLPRAFFEKNPQTIAIHWIDFYR